MDPPTTSSQPSRTIALPGGRALTVRHCRPQDADGLQVLYEELSVDDRYRRFFSGAKPRDFAEKWTRIGEHGGVCLVAVASEALSERVVAEAGFVLLPNGDGELGITVAPEWRGWLGAYLLDALVQEAAARSVPNLEAEVLVENGPMLALVKSRGHAFIDQDDWSSVRVTISTTGTTPGWPEADERPRVLVEVPGGHWASARRVRDAGMQVIACPGPTTARSCPALEGRPCPLAEHADVIVLAFPPSDEQAQLLLAAHARLHEDVPLVVAPSTSDETIVPPRVATAVPACTPAAEFVGIVCELAARHRDESGPSSLPG